MEPIASRAGGLQEQGGWGWISVCLLPLPYGLATEDVCPLKATVPCDFPFSDFIESTRLAGVKGLSKKRRKEVSIESRVFLLQSMGSIEDAYAFQNQKNHAVVRLRTPMRYIYVYLCVYMNTGICIYRDLF